MDETTHVLLQRQKMKTFNTKKVDWMKQPMFFGEEPNVQRFDQQKYPIFEKLNQQQLGFFWRPEEVSLQKDRNDYQSQMTRNISLHLI